MELKAFGKKLSDYHFKKFDKGQRSSFKYWFNHYKAYNLTAIALGVWKPKYLLHDIEKPWLMLFWKDYKRVQKWHRKHNNHHFGYEGKKPLDPEAMIIDWECSRFTKNAAPLTAREQAEADMHSGREDFINNKIIPMLDKLGLTE